MGRRGTMAGGGVFGDVIHHLGDCYPLVGEGGG
jgi:hypothetical protein